MGLERVAEHLQGSVRIFVLVTAAILLYDLLGCSPLKCWGKFFAIEPETCFPASLPWGAGTWPRPCQLSSVRRGGRCLWVDQGWRAPRCPQTCQRTVDEGRSSTHTRGGRGPKSPSSKFRRGQEHIKMQCDTEKEVHHVCFVTYQAKRTWATSFQAPEMGTDGQVSTRAHLLGSTWVEGTGSIRARWQAANTVLSMWARKQRSLCSPWRRQAVLLSCGVQEALAGELDSEQRRTADSSPWIKHTHPRLRQFQDPGSARGQNSIIRAGGFWNVCYQPHECWWRASFRANGTVWGPEIKRRVGGSRKASSGETGN